MNKKNAESVVPPEMITAHQREVDMIRESIISVLLFTVIIMGIPGLYASFLRSGIVLYTSALVVLYGLLCALYVLRHRVSCRLLSFSIAGISFATGGFILSTVGFYGVAGITYIMGVCVLSVFVSIRYGILFLVADLITVSVIFILYRMDMLHYKAVIENSKVSPVSWILFGLVVIIVCIRIITAVKKSMRAVNALLERIDESRLEIIEMNRQLRLKVEEREVLVKEVHHRVKNNLQVISSLLTLAGSYKSEECAEAMAESRLRIYAMAQVHNRLYRTESFSGLNFYAFLEDFIAERLRLSGDCSIVSRLTGGEVVLEMDPAITCALIVNELISNALSYAVPGGATTLEICLKENDGMCILSVSDNGPGLPGTIAFSEPDTMGFTLIRALARQLYGTVTIDLSAGTRVVVSFPLVYTA